MDKVQRAFLNNHIREMVSMDLLTVPTSSFRVLYALVVLARDRRRVVLTDLGRATGTRPTL